MDRLSDRARDGLPALVPVGKAAGVSLLGREACVGASPFMNTLTTEYPEAQPCTVYLIFTVRLRAFSNN